MVVRAGLRSLLTVLSVLLCAAAFAACGPQGEDGEVGEGGSGGNNSEVVDGNGDETDDNDNDNGGGSEETPSDEPNDNPADDSDDSADDDGAEEGGTDGNEKETNMNISIRIGEARFSATIDDSAAGRAFAAMLPLTLDMSELNGNEKYCYLHTSLPTAASRPGTIQTGDLMLYGSDCIVLFYKTFTSSYSYTRLGRADNPAGLAEALGGGSVTVVFE